MTTQTKTARTTGTVQFRTTQYQFAHGRKPKGRGSWAFEMNGETYWATSEATGSTMTYGEAKRAATAEARKRGVSTVTVMT